MAEGARITIDAQLQFRHDVEANWLAADPILKVGEPAYTIGYSDRFKLGDGQSKWSELPYLQLGTGGGGGGSQAYESLAWSAIKNLTSGDASVLAQAYAVKQAYNELKSLIPNLADYYTKEQVNALIPSLAGYATEAWVLGKGYATESFVNTKIADLINGAPTTLDTLKEIADAFAQSQDVIEALDAAIGNKANQSDLTALAARVAANEGNITSLSSNKLDKSIWDSVFEIDARGNLRAKVGIYSTSFISARTSDPSAGGGSGGEGGAFSLYNWEQVKAMTAEVGGVAPTAYALKQAYNELINATPTLSWNNIQDKPIFANVATSGKYSDLIGRPTALSDLANDVGYITSSAIPTTYAWSAITGKPSFAAVATSGSYNDLSNKPTIPSIAGLASESWVSNNFLGLSGGTIESTDTYGLVINAGADASGIQLQSNGTLKGILISGGTWGAAILNGNTFNGIGVLDDGTPYFKDFYSTGNTYTLIHSGNIGSYAPIYNSSGNVGIGTTSPAYKLDVNGSARFGNLTPADGLGTIPFSVVNSGYAATGWVASFGTSNGGVLLGYRDANSENVSILGTSKSTSLSILPDGGNLLIGTTTDAGYKLDVNGTARISGDLSASGTIYSAVGLYTPGYLSARSTAGASDRKLKTNIAPVKNALAYVLGTNYVSFDWKDTGEHSVGIIAQDELNREWSCLVQKYNEHYSYQYTQHTALLGSALQEEDEKVEALKAEVATLKAEVQRLRNERQLWQQ